MREAGTPSEPGSIASDPTATLAALSTVRDLARRRGLEAIAREAEEIEHRVGRGRFFLAVVGQFKRGKSSLINALLGEPVLPTGVLPVTSVITIVEHGETAGALVRFAGGEEEAVPLASIADYVTEELNPDNRRGVAALVVRHPCPLLRSGVCLIDTPGVGSVFQSSSAATHAFLPKVDAAVVVIGADPPISADEMALVERVAAETPDLLFALNKADLVQEADSAAVAAFCSRVIGERLRRPAPEILFVSARPGRGGEDAAVQDLARRIGRLARDAGGRLVQGSLERGARRLGAQLRGLLALQRRTLIEPVERLASEIESFRSESREMSRGLDDLAYLLRGETDRAVAWLHDEARVFLERQTPALENAIAARLKRLEGIPKNRLRAAGFREARGLLQERLDLWVKEMEPRMVEAYRRLTDRFVEAANAPASRIARAASQMLGVTIDPAPHEPGLRSVSRLYYHLGTEVLLLDPGGLATWVADRLMERSRVLRRVTHWLTQQAADLLHANVTRIVDDLHERLEESLRTFESDLRERLESALRTAEAAQAHAAGLRGRGAAAVAQAFADIDRDLEMLRGALAATLDIEPIPP